MKAAIFVGGKGKRLGSLTEDTPKVLIEIAGTPILDWQIKWLKMCGVDTVVLLAGRMADKIAEHAESVSNWGISVEFVQEIPDADTGGALKCSEKNLKDEKYFYIMNGDSISNMPLKKLKPGKYLATIALVNEPSPYGIVKTKGNKVIEFTEKPILKNVWINSGFIAATPGIFEYLPERGNLSDMAWKKLAEMGLMGCKKFKSFYWRDIGTLKDLEMATADVQSGAFKL